MVPAFERAKTVHALERAANVIGEIRSVHCAGLLDVHLASLYVVTAHVVGAANKLKVIHSVITRSVSQSVSAVLRHQVLYKLLSIVHISVYLWLV
jgi:hypothetical protein